MITRAVRLDRELEHDGLPAPRAAQRVIWPGQASIRPLAGEAYMAQGAGKRFPCSPRPCSGRTGALASQEICVRGPSDQPPPRSLERITKHTSPKAETRGFGTEGLCATRAWMTAKGGRLRLRGKQWGSWRGNVAPCCCPTKSPGDRRRAARRDSEYDCADDVATTIPRNLR